MDILVIVYMDGIRYSIGTRKRIVEYTETENIRQFISEEKLQHIAFIIPKYVPIQECRDIISDILKNDPNVYFIARRPSTLCKNTFEIPNLLYLNINIAEKDDLSLYEVDSNSSRSSIFVDEMKKEKISKHLHINLYYEVITETKDSIPTTGCFSGPIDEISSDIVLLIENSINSQELAKNVYIDSRNELLMRKFRDDITMKVCMKEQSNLARNINQIVFLRPPKYLRNIGFIWNTAKEDAIVCGLLKEIRNLEDENIFLSNQNIENLTVEDIL